MFQGDFSLPAAGQPVNDHIRALDPALEKLNLDFERYINVACPAAPQTKAELWKAAGKRLTVTNGTDTINGMGSPYRS